MTKDSVVISGVGLIGDFGVGKADFSNFLLNKKEKRKIRNFNFDDYIDTTMLRRADDNSCFATVAAKLAMEDAQLNTEGVPAERRGLILGTTHGPLDYSLAYHKELVLGNPQMASPLLFSNSTLNIMVSYVSNIFQICGYTTTITGYNAVLQAIKCGTDLIVEGVVDICLVGGVDIFNDILKEGYSNCFDNTLQTGRFGGSGVLVLESLESAKKRKVRAYAQVIGSEIITANYITSVNCDISPIRALLNRLKYKTGDINCILTSCHSDKDSKKRHALYLKKLEKDIPVADCSPLFGQAFSAAEAFKAILGALSLKGDLSLTEIYKEFPEKSAISNILLNSANMMDSNGCLLLERVKK